MSNAQTSRISITDLAAKKKAGQKWAMLTCYEQITSEIFDQAGIPVLLVGDSAGNNFLGFENTIPVTVDELIPMARAVVSASQKAMVVADFPFGSYESSPDQALATGVRFFKEAKVGAVKLEGGAKVVPHIQKHIPKCICHSNTSICSCTAANSQNNMCSAAHDGVSDQ